MLYLCSEFEQLTLLTTKTITIMNIYSLKPTTRLMLFVAFEILSIFIMLAGLHIILKDNSDIVSLFAAVYLMIDGLAVFIVCAIKSFIMVQSWNDTPEPELNGNDSYLDNLEEVEVEEVNFKERFKQEP